jgi:hypothetical protein
MRKAYKKSRRNNQNAWFIPNALYENFALHEVITKSVTEPGRPYNNMTQNPRFACWVIMTKKSVEPYLIAYI